MPTPGPAPTLPTPLRATTATIKAPQTEAAPPSPAPLLLELPVRFELRRSDGCRVRRRWLVRTASAGVHGANDSDTPLDISTWPRTPVRHTLSMPVDSDAHRTHCRDRHRHSRVSDRVFICDEYVCPREQSCEHGVIHSGLDKLCHVRQSRSTAHDDANECGHAIIDDGRVGVSVSVGERDSNSDESNRGLTAPREPIAVTTPVGATAMIATTTRMAPPSTSQPRHRIRLMYRDEAVRAGFCENAQRLIASVQSDPTNTTTSALLARKALRYRRVSLERVGQVDTRDPAFDVSAFFGVKWSKA